ncbi:MAG: hypothetical protein AAGD11_00325 [Planctomycetota bacterium]
MFDIEYICSELPHQNNSVYGVQYRGAAILTDGTHLDCVVYQSAQRVVDLAKRRFDETRPKKRLLGSSDHTQYDQIVKSFVASGNRVSAYDIQDVVRSKFAIPDDLRNQICGETFMGWTGWVFEMSDGSFFQYGSPYSFDFFSLPDGYDFEDVANVHNHSYLSASGALVELERGAMPPADYKMDDCYREKVSFRCAIDDI